MIQLRLKAKHEKRFKSHHPWVYSNELQEVPKQLNPGQPAILCDAGGDFLASGYVNPHSLITFRALSRNYAEQDVFLSSGFLRRFQKAFALRLALGLTHKSFRLCFGEADHCPGLVIDSYQLQSERLLVLQIHTAGMDILLPVILEALKQFDTKASILIRKDLQVRKLEGLTIEKEPEWRGSLGSLNPEKLKNVLVDVGVYSLKANLWHGQKTGLFLDQSQNVKRVTQTIAQVFKNENKKSVKILDLCCYVGHWSLGIATELEKQGISCDVTLVDQSQEALTFAQDNLENKPKEIKVMTGDVFSILRDLPKDHYDFIICDPPALIKSRKDLAIGTRAYLQLNTLALECLAASGWVVSFSCSSLFDENSFRDILIRAQIRTKKTVQWTEILTQGPDHPVLAAFPEGRYLKGWLGRFYERM